METRTSLVLSVLHLKPETYASLTLTDPDDWPVAGGRWTWGLFIYALEAEPGPGLPAREDLSEELAACMTMARSYGCQYVLFDVDGETVDGLEVFDHGEQD